jgi:hypothetical protein
VLFVLCFCIVSFVDTFLPVLSALPPSDNSTAVSSSSSSSSNSGSNRAQIPRSSVPAPTPVHCQILQHVSLPIPTTVCTQLHDCKPADMMQIYFVLKIRKHFPSRWEKPPLLTATGPCEGRQQMAVKVHASGRWRHTAARQAPRHLNISHPTNIHLSIQ